MPTFDLNLSTLPGPIGEKQAFFVNAGEPGWKTYREMHYVGAPNTGKTFGLADSLIISALNYPGSSMALVRDKYTNLMQSAFMTLKKRVPQFFEGSKPIFEHKVNDRTIVVRLPGLPDSEIALFGLDVPGSLEKLLGYEPFRVFVDQAEGIDEELLQALHARLGRYDVYHRESGIKGQSFIKCTSNWHKGTNWIYHRTQPGAVEFRPDFFERTVKSKDLHGNDRQVKILMMKVRSEENLARPDQYDDHYVLAGGAQNRMFTPDWAATEGKVFPEFSAERHEIGAVDDLEGSIGVVGLDHGISHPTVAVFGAIDQRGQIVVVDEYLQADRSAAQNAQAIAQRMAVLNRRGINEFTVYYDSSMDRRESDLSSVADRYRAVFESLPFHVSFEPSSRKLKNADYYVEAGIGVMKERLTARIPSGHPLIQIARPSCREVIKMLAGLTYEDIEKDVWGTVDVFDALRYLIINTPDQSAAAFSKPGGSYAPRYRRAGAA